MPVLLICVVCDKKYSVNEASKAHGQTCRRCKVELIHLAEATASDCVAETNTYARELSQSNISLEQLPDRIGQHGRYKILSLLGAGAFGRVYLALDLKLRRQVALKVPHPGIIDGANGKRRFLREAEAGAKLRHANIVPVHDVDHDGTSFYISSAYIKGKTLKDVLSCQPRGFIWPATVICILADALAHAHKKGVVHRDVKPSNIIIDRKGIPHLTDFGLAWLGDAAGSITHVDTAIGTPAYMSPEQGGTKTGGSTGASDQYSLGVVFFEMLCGDIPFHGLPTYVISCHRNQPPPIPRLIDPSIPVGLESICLKLLEKRPEDRYEDCTKLTEDLQRWLDGKPVLAPPSTAAMEAVAELPEVILVPALEPVAPKVERTRRSGSTTVPREPKSTQRREKQSQPRASSGGCGVLLLVVLFIAALIGIVMLFAHRPNTGKDFQKAVRDNLGWQTEEFALAEDIAAVERQIRVGDGSASFFTDQNTTKKIDRWKLAAERGLPAGQYLYGRALELGEKGNKQKAVDWYRKSAEKGFALAQNNLGFCYQNAIGVGQDTTEAVRWYRKASENKLGLATFNLAGHFRHGSGATQKDEDEAVRLYQKSVGQGYPRSCFELGQMYATGVNGRIDIILAEKWYTRGAELGNWRCQAALKKQKS